MKKIKLLLPTLVLILFLSFSFLIKPSVNAATVVGTPATDEEKIAYSIESIKANMPERAIASFPVTYVGGFGETIVWTSSNTDVIDVSHIADTNGWAIVHRDAVTDESETVIITVTVTLNDKTTTATKDVIVPKGTTTSKEYSITYVGVEAFEHSNPAKHSAGNYVELTDATKEGYIFDGWFIDNVKVTCLPVGIYKDTTVTARFTAIKLESIEITTQPTKLTYTALENFDKTGIKVDAKYTDNTVVDVTDDVTFDKTSLHAADTTVTVSYTDGDVTKTATINITVNKILLTTPVVETKYSSVYDGTTHSIDIVATEGITVSFEGNNSLKNVGSENITVKFELTNTDDYELDKAEVSTVLEVTPKSIVVTADNKTSVYGEDLAELTCNIATLVEGDTLTFDLTKKGTNNVGTYDIVVAKKADVNYDNYNITLNNGIYTITKATLIITPNVITINLGAHLPTTVTVTYAGFVNEETETVLNGELTYDFSNVKTNEPGTYKYTIAGLTSDNYNITFAEGTVIVNRTTVEVVLEELTTEYDGTTKNIVPTFKDGEKTVIPTTINISYSNGLISLDSIKDAGIYTILVSFEDDELGTGSKEFTYTITPKEVTIKVNDQSYEFTGSAVTVADDKVVTGLVNDDDLGTILVVLKDVESAVDLGEYTLTATYTENTNYTVTVDDGTLTIVMSDTEKVDRDSKELDTLYEAKLTGTIFDIETLKVNGTFGSTIKWTSSNTLVNINETNGEVTITKGDSDQIEIVLTATITSGDEFATRVYAFTYSFVENKGTESNPYTAREAYDEADKLNDKEFSSEKVYVSGIIKTATYNTEKNHYQITIVDSVDSSIEFIIFVADLAAGLNKEDVVVGATITAYGYLYKYNTTPELYGDDKIGRPIVTSIILTNDFKLSAAKTQVETELDKYTSLTTAPTDKLIVNAKYGSTVTYTSSNSSILSIGEDGTITINPSEESDTIITVTYTISLDDSSVNGTKEITVKKVGSVTVGPNKKYTLAKETYSSIISTDKNAKLKLSKEPTYESWDSSPARGLQLGSSGTPMGQFTITADYSDSVSTVKVKVATANSGKSTLSISVGGVALKCGTATSISVTTTSTEYTFVVESGSVLTGDVIISVNASSKAFYILSVEIN